LGRSAVASARGIVYHEWNLFKVHLLKRLRLAALIVAAVTLLVSPGEARNRRGDKFFKEGRKAENQKEYDRALDLYDKAVATDPQDPEYLLADRRARNEASQQHVALGRELLRQQKLDEALVQFQKAFVADPSSQIALQELEQTTIMIKERRSAPPGTPILTPAEKARQAIENRINSLEGPPTLKPINAQITSLKMNNQPARVLYESIGKLAGINVLFDPQGIEAPGATHNFNLDLHNVSLEEALNYVALITHTFWKPISHNAIFVTQESEMKRLEYQDEVVKVFYIQNASTPAEFGEMFNAIRVGSKLNTGLYQVPSQYAIIARGSPDTIALIEKLVHDLDRPKPEVLVDVIVMSVSKTKMSTIGAALLGQGGLSVPLQFAPTNPINTTGTTTSTTGTTTTTTGTTTGTTGITTGTTGITTGTTGITTGTTGITTGTTGITTGTTSFIDLSRLAHLSTHDYAISLPSTLVQALMTDADTRILQRPEVRAIDGGKAVLKVGQKLPYVSGSLNSAIATPGAIPYATTQFQTVDVGTQIEFQPHVNGPEDVTMHIKVDLTNLLQWLTIAGVQEPEIGQQSDEADIRMKDGEVSLLGGLTDTEQSLTLSGFPGLTNMPLLGYLFGTKVRNSQDNEILIALVPHIIRSPEAELAVEAQEGVYAGTDRVTHVQRAPQGAQPSTPVILPPTVPPAVSTPLGPTPNPPSQPSQIKPVK
jgi:general secretion pathway protein D